MNWYKISEEQLEEIISRLWNIVNGLQLVNKIKDITLQVRQQPLPEPSGELEKLRQKLAESEESERELEDLVLSAKHMKEKAEQELADARAEIERLKPPEPSEYKKHKKSFGHPTNDDDIVCSVCGLLWGEKTKAETCNKKSCEPIKYSEFKKGGEK